MFGLSRELVEHGPPINPSFRLNKQAARLYNPAMYDQIKEENNSWLQANFIRDYKNAEWIFSIV
jgi:hypothetical protein